MLTALSVRNIVLIEQLDLSLGRGLCVLTGETGAGKSILLDALGLALGARGDGGLVRRGVDKGSVIAVFDLAFDHQAFPLIRAAGIESEGELILKRIQSADGRAQAFINDQPVSVGLLRELGQCLIEIHGQHDARGLMDTATHRAILDLYGGHKPDLARVQDNYHSLAAAKKVLAVHQDHLARVRAEEDYIRHALGELQALDPQTDEETALADKRSLMMSAEKIVTDLQEALAALGGEHGMDQRLNAAQRRLVRVNEAARSKLEPITNLLDKVLVEANEAHSAISQLISDMRYDTAELERTEERLFALRAAARKYNVPVEKLPVLRDDFASRVSALTKDEDRLAQLQQACVEAQAAYDAAARTLSKKRSRAAQKIDLAVMKELPPLKLEKATFITRLETAQALGGPEGVDKVTFHVATNPGTEPAPLSRIASGGELARFMLALRVVLAQNDETATFVFDEIDAGVSGAVAEAVGVRLARLAEAGQVLVVTHSPQVAARGDHHFRIDKRSDSSAKDAPVKTLINQLDGPGRREEIARMLSGARVTDEARAAADQLMVCEGG